MLIKEKAGLWTTFILTPKEIFGQLVRSPSGSHLDEPNSKLSNSAFVNALTLIHKHFTDPSIPSPSSVFRVSINTGPSSFYGEKFKVDRVFEDDGSLASGVTTAAYDSQRKKLFMSGKTSFL